MRRIGSHSRILVASLLAAAGIVLAGCVSSPEVKLASAQMTAALEELDEGLTLFRDLHIAEIEKTRADIGSAIVARAVANKINELSGNLEDDEWQEKFKKQGLIALSKEIEEAQDIARILVNQVSRITLKRDEVAAVKLDELLSKQVKMLRVSAEALRQNKQEREARELEEKAVELEEHAPPLVQDPMIGAYLKAILELGAMKAEVPQNLENLETLVKMLRKTHAVIDEWIMTDVTVSGAQVGQLVVRHAKELGLDTTTGRGGAE